jgi:asparagine synthase (glutamine-hydrolysing)
MCGISCCLALNGHKPRDASILEKTLESSLDVIKHRGPDSRGHWISEDCRVGL